VLKRGKYYVSREKHSSLLADENQCDWGPHVDLSSSGVGGMWQSAVNAPNEFGRHAREKKRLIFSMFGETDSVQQYK